LLGLSDDVAALGNDPSMWPQLREAMITDFERLLADGVGLGG
jgi:hypothetical protein